MDQKVLKLKVTNCYLIGIGDQYLLVDTGYEYEWELFCKRLDEVGIGLPEIRYVLLTHPHDDHCGLLNKIVAANSNVRVIVSHHAKEILLSGKHHHTPGAGYINKRIRLLLPIKGKFDKKWTHTFPPYKVRANDILITKDTHFRQIGIDLNGKIIETPGHSTDHISVLFDDGDCIAGDAAANFLQWAGTKYCVISIDNLDQYYKSWEKIIAGKARRIFPAHGKPFASEVLKKNLGKNKKENMVLLLQARSGRTY
jgi:glyoxylase-like metal-dependent hydrolase (beta-lactamase superfamily II)